MEYTGSFENSSTGKNGDNVRSLLWRIEEDDFAKPSYYFGTMHLMCAEDIALSEQLMQVIEEVDQIYLEVDMTNASEVFTKILQKRESGKLTLKNVLTRAEYDKIKGFFEVHQPTLSFSIVEKQPPLMITASLYELLLPCELKNGVEVKILEEAARRDKPILGLETIEFQANVFNSIPYREQVDDLLKTVDNLETSRTLLYDMIEAYKQQDIEQLFKLSASDKSIAGNYLDILLFKRNQNWVSKFYNIAKDTSTLFAVGAGHLGGKMGVVNLLRKQGYKVMPVTLP